MRVVFAPDSFGGTLSAAQAATAMAEGWSAGAPHDAAEQIPLSDGGPGFVDVLASAHPDAELIPVTVSDPLGRPVPATFLLTGDGTAYVESAQACGLHLLAEDERDPERTTTTGVGELLGAAVAAGARTVVVGLGGSATNDGGQGLWEQLGGAWPAGVGLVAATDVNAPLLGHHGATAVFGPQKGASRAALVRLEARMEAWADELEAAAGRSVRGRDGAGGLGAALLALGGTREPGIQLVLDAVGLPARLDGAGAVVTGEGRFDAVSLRSKVPNGVARTAQAAGVPCLVLAGLVEVGDREARAAGFDAVHSTVALAGSPEESRRRPDHWLRELATRVARQWSPPHRNQG
ncbi:MAG TPA: glycerate kinase [Mycobacteriales bacterium]|nr:glycerate kinase [Mycobacteriales bacterium]